jgi:hypothetical protein
MQLYKEVTSPKQLIFIVLALQEYLSGECSLPHFQRFVLQLMQEIDISFYEEELLQREILKAYFLQYLTHAKDLLQSIPTEAKEKASRFWEDKEKQVGTIFIPSD